MPYCPARFPASFPGWGRRRAAGRRGGRAAVRYDGDLRRGVTTVLSAGRGRGCSEAEWPHRNICAPRMKPPLPWSRRSRWKKIAGALGPGLVGGGADNDPAGIATFTVIGASSGFAHLWLMVITAPMETAVQTVCGVIGADSQHGLASLLRLRF